MCLEVWIVKYSLVWIVIGFEVFWVAVRCNPYHSLQQQSNQQSKHFSHVSESLPSSPTPPPSPPSPPPPQSTLTFYHNDSTFLPPSPPPFLLLFPILPFTLKLPLFPFHLFTCSSHFTYILIPPHLCVSHLLVLWSPLLPAPDLQDALWGDPLAPLHRGPLAAEEASHQQGPPRKVPTHYLAAHSGSPKLEIHSGCVADMVSSGKDRFGWFGHFFTESRMTILLLVQSLRHFNHQVHSAQRTIHSSQFSLCTEHTVHSWENVQSAQELIPNAALGPVVVCPLLGMEPPPLSSPLTRSWISCSILIALAPTGALYVTVLL